MPAPYRTGKIVCLVVPAWSSAPLHWLLAEWPDSPCFGPPPESLSLCSRERESNQRESAPDIRVWPAARLPSLRCRSEGRRTRGIHAPRTTLAASLRLAPLRDTCARPPDGNRAPSCLKALSRLRHGLSGRAGCPLQEAERNRRGRGRAARMPREPRWAMDGPSRRAPGTAM
ncbi:hypothetical protein AvCA_00510 [Azotobacter vinelandii CA]|uniref:Uncharacterized protein n=2 Tax=Azotobacter vinelandii TaxID=354 RepID=C1DFZ1_AZOVD|nr:hypothetical protein Avin_00510 [Azotobacter vinelandii DJ]AGK17455.1 hypothetical protein AvCA_00510 [Azotobacter vinelandii CA]AGK19033.1 hypothetical protein AvCA6_00510 [Azotobacter vinelandii CA6]